MQNAKWTWSVQETESYNEASKSVNAETHNQMTPDRRRKGEGWVGDFILYMTSDQFHNDKNLKSSNHMTMLSCHP